MLINLRAKLNVVVRSTLTIVAVSGAAWSCRPTDARQSPHPSPTFVALASGQQIQVLTVSSRDRDGQVALFIDYLTKRPIRDRVALQEEVDEVWCALRPDAQKSGANKVFVIPNDAPIGGALTTFVFDRHEDGSWWRQGETAVSCGPARVQPRQ